MFIRKIALITALTTALAGAGSAAAETRAHHQQPTRKPVTGAALLLPAPLASWAIPQDLRMIPVDPQLLALLRVPAVAVVPPQRSIRPISAHELARQIVPANQFASFDAIITRESGWNVHATNASSGAYGLGQALPAGKMAAAGSDWRHNPATQIRWALNYMNGRYGSPNAAWAFWRSHNWY